MSSEFFGFPVHIKAICTLYCCLLGVQQHYVKKKKKKNVHTLIKKYFIAEKCWSSSELSESHNLFACGEFCLDVDGGWLSRVIAEGQGGCGNFSKWDNKVCYID